MASRVGLILSFGIALGTVVTVITTGSSRVPAIVTAVLVCVLLVPLVVVASRQSRERYVRLTQYGPASMPMRRAMTCLAGASWHLFEGDASQDAFRLRLKESLRYLAEAFTLITGYQCRASIKVIRAAANGTGQDVQVYTLCRNDRLTGHPKEPDRIGDNTDFKLIFTDAMGHFLCNDLPKQIMKGGYRNSHWDEETIAAEKFEYRSTIVWPIERYDDESTPTEPREIIGFLCVDSGATEVFHQTYDVAIVGAFSQALHLALHRYRKSEGSHAS